MNAMKKPTHGIEVPLSTLSFEEQSEVEEKLSTGPLDPLAALELIEEASDLFDLEVVVELRNLHMAGVQITLSLASRLLMKGNNDE